jgi:hypothetical protein
MPKPVAPYEWGMGATSSVTAFTRQVSPGWSMIEPTTVARLDGGSVQTGLYGIRLYWKTLKPVEWDQLMGFYNTAIAAAGIFFLRWWDSTASSGAGAWTTTTCRVRQRPTYEDNSGLNYAGVTWDIHSLGIS